MFVSNVMHYCVPIAYDNGKTLNHLKMTTNQISKAEIENLIDKLADKSLNTNLFNLNETEKDWMDSFYESGWTVDTMSMTSLEEKICAKLTGGFLYRHMEVYDWNLPYAEAMILIVRQEMKKYLEGTTHDIMIGSILEKMKEQSLLWELANKECQTTAEQLLYLWEPLDFTKSLQEIFAECEWEDEGSKCDHVVCNDAGYRGGCQLQVPKDPNVRSLAEFLISLNLTK